MSTDPVGVPLNNVYGDFDPLETPVVVFIVLFLFATLFTLFQVIRHGPSRRNIIGMCFLLLGAPLLEFVGYAILYASVKQSSDTGLYLANMLLIILGGLYLTAANWIVFPALIHFAGEHFSKLKAPAVFLPFIIILLTVIHLQIRGTAQAYNYTNYNPNDVSSHNSYRVAASAIAIAGFGLTLIMWIIYAILFMVFVTRYYRHHSITSTTRIRNVAAAVFINIVVFMIRDIYRMVEYSLLVQYGEQISDIWLYIFDAAPIFIAIMAFAIVMPNDLEYAKLFKAVHDHKRKRRARRCGNSNREESDSTNDIPVNDDRSTNEETENLPSYSAPPPSYRGFGSSKASFEYSDLERAPSYQN